MEVFKELWDTPVVRSALNTRINTPISMSIMSLVTKTNGHEQGPVTIDISDRRSSFSEAQQLAKALDSRLPTLKEFIIALKDPEFFKIAKGNCYWLNGSGLSVSGYFEINYNKGELERPPKTQTSSFSTPVDRRAYAYSGKGPLILFVREVEFALRLEIAAVDWQAQDALVALVPVKQLSALQSEVDQLLVSRGVNPEKREEIISLLR